MILKGTGMNRGGPAAEPWGGFFRLGQRANSYPGDQGSWGAHRKEREAQARAKEVEDPRTQCLVHNGHTHTC